MNTNKTPKQLLEDAVGALRSERPDPATMEAAGERVWQQLSQMQADVADNHADAPITIGGCADVRRLLPDYRSRQLSSARALVLESHLHECVACRKEAESGPSARTALKPWQHELPRVANPGFHWALAAAAVIVIGITAYLIQDQFFAGPSGMRARVESLRGSLLRVGLSGEQPLKPGDELREGESVRAGSGSDAMLRLRDGSLVELNERAQLAVSMRRNDTTVQLDRGNIIIQAAKRQTGHLYVAARDCRVAVTGTVFSVHSGIKGSRVSVIAGEVRVMEAGSVKILHPGDQLSTNPSVAAVPVQKEIAWSQNADQHLALLAEFVHFSNKLDTIPLPGLRYQSNLLPLLPASTVLYAAIPNLGDAAQQANQLFDQELQESPVLRQWWQQAQAHKRGPDLKEILTDVHELGAYLGNEIVFSFSLGQQRGYPLVVAQVEKPGLQQFISQQYANQPNIVVVDEPGLKALSQTSQKELVILARRDFVAASSDVATLQQFDNSLNQGSGGFAGTAFGTRMAHSYGNGAWLLFGADLEEMAAHHKAQTPHDQAFAGTGLGDVQYLVAERKESSGQTQNYAVLTFNGARHGMASWLAAPAPIGGLDYVSKDAAAAGAFIAKNPSQMLDDVLTIAFTANPNAENELNQLQSELKINLHQDLVDTLGGEITFALDGPLLPTPSWKIVAEVYDPVRLQATMNQLVSDVNQRVPQGKYGVALDQSSANGLTYYTLRSLDPAKAFEINYTFSNGFVILGPSRALVMEALNIHDSGNSLARSAAFRGMLPQDEHADVSAVLYQNLAPVVNPVMQQLTPSQLQSLQQLAAESKPSVVCAYGEDNAVRVASTSRFFGLDLNTLALSTLLKLAQPGGSGKN